MSIEFSDQELAALKKEYANLATDAQFTLWIEMCKRRKLVPVEDVVLQLRSVQEYEERPDGTKIKNWVKKVVFITTLRALLKLAERTGKYKGFVPAQYIYLDDTKKPTVVSEFPLPDPENENKPLIPWAVKVGVKRAGFDEPQYEIARFWAYAQTYKDGEKVKLNSTWTTRGPEQLVKCCKAATVRGAFPEELGGLFLEEELQNEELVAKATETKPAEPAKTTAPAVTPAAPKPDHTPAVGKVAPRPGEEKPATQTTTTPAAEAATTAKLPEYTPPLTVETKIEHNKQAQEALNKATAPETKPEPAAETGKKKAEKKSTAKKKKEDPKPKTEADPKAEPKVDPPAATASEVNAAAATETTAPAVENQDADPPPDAERLPSKDESADILTKLGTFRDKLGGAGSEHSKQLRTFILKTSGQTDTKLITAKQWSDILKRLGSAVDNDDLKSIVAAASK